MTFIYVLTIFQTAMKLVKGLINKSLISFHVGELFIQNHLLVLNSISLSTKDNLLCKLFFTVEFKSSILESKTARFC